MQLLLHTGHWVPHGVSASAMVSQSAGCSGSGCLLYMRCIRTHQASVLPPPSWVGGVEVSRHAVQLKTHETGLQRQTFPRYGMHSIIRSPFAGLLFYCLLNGQHTHRQTVPIPAAMPGLPIRESFPSRWVQGYVCIQFVF